MLWRVTRRTISHWNGTISPTLFGSGRVNPTQNLVDAFPMANGLPITHPESGYDPNNPYANRDSRLALYILYNGSKAGPQNSTITTAADGSDNNALNRTETSTRTGYYTKKLLNQSVNANPDSETPAYHYKPYPYTERFLGLRKCPRRHRVPQEG